MSLSFGNFSNSNNNTNTGLSFNNNNNNNKSNSNTGLSFSNNNNNMNNNMSSSSFANNNNNNMSMNMSSMNRNASIMSGRVREAQFGSLKPELQNYITQLGVKILREKIEAKIVSEHSNQRLQVLYQQVNRLETDLTDIRVSTDSAKSVVDRMRKRTNRDMNYVEEAQRVVLRRNEPPPIHSEVELPPMFFRDARQRCEEHMDFYTAQIDSMREILLPSGSRGSRGVSPSGGNNLMMRTDRGNTNFVLNSAGRFDRLGNGNAVSAQYGRRARVTAGDLKQIMQAQADAFFGMSSEIAALHEHVEMLKDKYLREIRREFRNTTSNQRDLMDSSRRNMSRWERGGDLGDRDPFKRRVLELEEEKRVWEFEDKVKRNLDTLTGVSGGGLRGLIQLNSSSNKNSGGGMNFGNSNSNTNSSSSGGMAFGNNNNFGSGSTSSGGGMSFGGSGNNKSGMSFGGSGNNKGGMSIGGGNSSTTMGGGSVGGLSFGGGGGGSSNSTGGGLSFGIGGNNSSSGLSFGGGGGNIGGGGGGLKFGT